MREMTFPYGRARRRAAECKPSPRKGAAALPAELPAQPPQRPKYRQFIKLAICLKAQVCKRRKTATNRRPKSPPLILPSRPQQEQQPPRRSSRQDGDRPQTSAEQVANEQEQESERNARHSYINTIQASQKAKQSHQAAAAGKSTHGIGGNICQRPRQPSRSATAEAGQRERRGHPSSRRGPKAAAARSSATAARHDTSSTKGGRDHHKPEAIPPKSGRRAAEPRQHQAEAPAARPSRGGQDPRPEVIPPRSADSLKQSAEISRNDRRNFLKPFII